MTRRHVPALVAAVAALLALPPAAQATEPFACVIPDEHVFKTMTVVSGRTHEFDASCSTDKDKDTIVLYEWDLDGNGSFETSTGPSPFVSHVFDVADFPGGFVDFGWRVTDSAGERGSWTVRLGVVGPINSWFLFKPQIVNPGDLVELTAVVNPPVPETPGDGATSWTYEWDLDGDGGYELATGTDPHAGFPAPAAIGRHPVGLRVTDNLGNVSTAQRDVEVVERHPSRDQVAWNAPPNLGATPVVELQAKELATAIDPPGPVVPPTGAPEADQVRTWRPKLSRLAANRNGLTVEYTGGLKGKRYKVVVKLPARRAAKYGLPRRTVVLARGTFRFDGEGTGKVTMRWTKGAYRIFRRVNHGVVNILATAIDDRR